MTAVLNNCSSKIYVSRDPAKQWEGGHMSALVRVLVQQVSSFLAGNHPRAWTLMMKELQ